MYFIRARARIAQILIYCGRNRRFHLGIWDDSSSALLSVQEEIIY